MAFLFYFVREMDRTVEYIRSDENTRVYNNDYVLDRYRVIAIETWARYRMEATTRGLSLLFFFNSG